MKTKLNQTNHNVKREKLRLKENKEKIKLNTGLPYLVGNVVEVRLLDETQGAESNCFYRFLTVLKKMLKKKDLPWTPMLKQKEKQL